MNTQAQLCHIDHERCVVLVTAFEQQKALGSALGEGASAEAAEDRALERLRSRFQAELQSEVIAGSDTSTPPIQRSDQPTRPAPRPEGRKEQTPQSRPSSPKPSSLRRTTMAGDSSEQAHLTATDTPAMAVVQAEAAPSEAPTDPDDWSDELAAVDLEIQRIGWDREQERSYLERAFGHSSRHKLTRYSDLIAYLKRLNALGPGTPVDVAPVPLRRGDLITQGDQMLEKLEWSGEQARTFLQNKLGANSRQALSDEQLLTFNMLLENELVESATGTDARKAGLPS